jgi:putative thioredoxin
MADEVLASAIKRYQSGDIDSAIQELRNAAEADPSNLSIPMTLAKLLMHQGQFDRAEELLMSLPEQDRTDNDIAHLLAHLGFIRAAEEAPDANELLATLENDGNAHEARYQLAALLLLNDETEAALEQLLELLQRDPSFSNGVARQGMSAILNMLGPDDEVAREYHKQMLSLIH